VALSAKNDSKKSSDIRRVKIRISDDCIALAVACTFRVAYPNQVKVIRWLDSYRAIAGVSRVSVTCTAFQTERRPSKSTGVSHHAKVLQVREARVHTLERIARTGILFDNPPGCTDAFTRLEDAWKIQ
jgi:hypothetical protein